MAAMGGVDITLPMWTFNDVKIASQITSLPIVFSTVYSDLDQSNYQSSASLAFVQGIHREPVNSPHKWPVMREMLHLMTSWLYAFQQTQIFKNKRGGNTALHIALQFWITSIHLLLNVILVTPMANVCGQYFFVIIIVIPTKIKKSDNPSSSEGQNKCLLSIWFPRNVYL